MSAIKTSADLKLIVNNQDKDQGRLDIDDKPRHPRLKPDWRGPDGDDWLSPLARIPGTKFKARDKVQGRRWQVLEFTCLGKMLGDVYLAPAPFIEDTKSWFWVDPLIFCKEWEFRGVTEIPGEETHAKD